MKTYNYRKPYSKEEGVLVNYARKHAKNYVWAFHCMWSQCGNVYVRLMDNWFQPCFEILVTHFITWQKAWVYFRILSRAKISIYSLCDTHLIKTFARKRARQGTTCPRERVEMPSLQRNESVCYLFLLMSLSDVVNDQFWSHCSVLVASECSTCLLSLSKYLSNLGQKFDIGWNRDRLLSSALRVPTLQKCVNVVMSARKTGKTEYSCACIHDLTFKMNVVDTYSCSPELT